MSEAKPSVEFLERFQALYSKDPASRVFAPLTEAYRKLGYLKQAHDIGFKGVRLHPNFPSGRVAFARVLIDMEQYEAAVPHLEATAELSPENILAHSLLAETSMKLGRHKNALKAYKMILFLNPHDERAQKAIRKLETVTSDEYEDDAFRMTPLKRVFDRMKTQDEVRSQTKSTSPSRIDAPLSPHQKQRNLERALSLIDAFIFRNDFERAAGTIEETETLLGGHPELLRRRRILSARDPFPEKAEPLTTRREDDIKITRIVAKNAQIEKLEALLKRIQTRRS